MEVRATGLDAAQERLAGIAARLRDPTPILTVIAEDTRALIDDSFAESRSPDGTPWRPLSAATLSINPRRIGGKPLIDTARLRQSQTTDVHPRGMRFGTNVRYAAPQQLGARIRVFGRGPERELVARPFLPVTGSPGRFQLMTTGPAGAHWARAREQIRRYIATGEIT